MSNSPDRDEMDRMMGKLKERNKLRENEIEEQEGQNIASQVRDTIARNRELIRMRNRKLRI